jgi:hypothetical protein
MTLSRERMLRLQDMAGLVLDARKQALRRANEARDALVQQLADLDARPADPGLPLAAMEQARFAYEVWADVRRAEINQRLAVQRVECIMLADQTRQAFGRTLALDNLAARQPPRRAVDDTGWQQAALDAQP